MIYFEKDQMQEYISRCCYCHYWNPARKQRPVAPRLPDPPPTPPTPRTQEPARKPEGKKTMSQIRVSKPSL